MNEVRMANELSVVGERKEVNRRSHPLQGPTLILEPKDMQLHLSSIVTWRPRNGHY
jgi:hypothetical protein